MRLRPLALGVVACACCGTVATAQGMPNVEARREFTGSFSVRSLYDSNFSRSSSATANQRGVKPKEYSVTPTISVRLVQPIGQQVVYVSGDAGYNFYKENDQLNRIRGQAQGGYVTRLGPCGLFATGSYAAAQSDLALIDSPNIKNLAQSTTIGAGAQCSRGRGLNAGISAQRTETTNSAEVQKQVNATSEVITATLSYGKENVGVLGVSYAYADSELPNRVIPGRATGDGFFTQSLSVTAERQFGSRLYARASAGRSMVKREFSPPGVDAKFSSTTYSAAIDYQLGSRLKLGVVGDRSIVPSARAGKVYDIRTSGRASATYNLGSRFVVGLGHSIEDIKSNTDTSLPLRVITDSRTNSTFGSLRYKQSERASVVLDVSYDDRSANLREFDYTATRVGLSVEVGF